MIIAIVGPTGVGKTALSEHLASRYNYPVVNSDSVQVYTELNIGSAKPKKEEMCDMPHYLFDIKNINDYYSVKNYQDDLRNIIDNKKDIVLVGGTGLYVTAGLYNYEFDDETDNNMYDNLSNDELYKLCLEKDSACNIHINNRVRLIRFLNQKNKSTKGNELLYDTIFIGLKTDRENLYNRINKRVDEMIEEGLLDEVKELYKNNKDSRILNSAIGYKELIEYLDNKVSLEDAIENIKKKSRNYAKRQFTWFNNKMDVKWFDVNYDDFNETINEVENYIEKVKNEK